MFSCKIVPSGIDVDLLSIQILKIHVFQDMDKSPLSLKREKSLAKLEELRKRTEEVRFSTAAAAKESMFANAVSVDDMPDLFKPVGEMLQEGSTNELIGTPPDPPYYMVVRVDKSKKNKKSKWFDVQSFFREAKITEWLYVDV